MRLLLDTNIALPLGNGRAADLPRSVSEALAERETELFVSVASLWEIVIKHRLGKLELLPPLGDLPDIWVALGIAILPVTPEHALGEALPEPLTKDPFDRLLLAICAVGGLLLVTTDDKLSRHRFAHPGLSVTKAPNHRTGRTRDPRRPNLA